ncbi:hypothetical protein [Thermococcus sp.]
MIALIMGMILGIPVAFILGKLLGKASEVLMALVGIPIIAYATALHELGMFIGLNVSIEGFSPEFIAGAETFLALIVALGYVKLRTRRGLGIDDFIQTGLSIIPYTSFGIALAAQFWEGFLLLGSILIGLLILKSMKNPLRGLNVKPCPQELGECLTDEESLMGARIGGRVVIGGRTLRDFPHAKELIECLRSSAEVPKSRKIAGFIVYLLPLSVVLLPPGGLTVVVGLGIAYTSTLLSAALVTKGLPTLCPEVTEEYKEFIRKRKKKLDIQV